MDESARCGKLLEKKKQTSLKKFGTTHHEKSLFYRDEKRKRNIEKWGVEHHWSLEVVKEKRIQTWLNKYGVTNPFNVPEIKRRIEDVNLERYGAKNPFASPMVKEKIKKRLMETYGVEFISQVEHIHRKQVEGITGMDYDYYYDTFLDKLLSYRKKVWAETKKQKLSTLENYDKRGKGKNDFHLDHIFSIKQGFIENVDPKIIGNISNLRMILSSENLSKNMKCDIDLEKLEFLYEELRKRETNAKISD